MTYCDSEGVFGEMKLRRSLRNNYALAGVLEAILLIALVAIILSIIQLYYVPVIMEQKEADHMDQVANQFSQLKSVIEIQSMMGAQPTTQPIVYSPMSSPITLGSMELPYFVSARSHGHITIIDQDDATSGNHIINIQPGPNPFASGIPLTSIKYRATNFYYPTEHWQEYILEGGGIILKQSDGEVMRIIPGISVENHTDQNYLTIKYFVPIFNGYEGKKIYGHWEDCYIYTNFSSAHQDNVTLTVGNGGFMKFATDYPNAWNDAFVNETRGILYEYNQTYLNVNIDDSASPNEVIITPVVGCDILLVLTMVELYAQVGPGVVYTN